MPAPISPLAVSAFTVTSALGLGLRALAEGLRAARSALRPNDFTANRAPDCWIGRVDAIEATPLPSALAPWDCRNNRLAWLALLQDDFLSHAQAAVARYGAARVACIIGTSTSSIGATEDAYAALTADGEFPAALRRPIVHTPHSLGDFVEAAIGTQGPCVTVNTACSSSAKVFAQAERLLRLGLCDAAVVGGVDTLCGSILFGFNSLQLLSKDRCKPFDTARDGINLGEAGGFALLERHNAVSAPLSLTGWGESSDAHHMSSPHPEGLGAELAMRDALARAGRAANDVQYINAHGTASLKNDEIEALAINRVFPSATRLSSTKSMMAHTLGAAGMVEAGVCLVALQEGLLPPNVGSVDFDAAIGPRIVREPETQALRCVLSNNFGFGGNNCSLVFERT